MEKNSIMAKLSSLFFISLFLQAALFATCCRGKPQLQAKKDAARTVPFFLFGDSYLDVGNNIYINTSTLDQANFWPYGETYFDFPTGRFSDGRLISDIIAKHANLPFIQPFLQPGFQQYYLGVNFASAGAGALAETFQGFVIDLKSQLSNYYKAENWLRQKLGNDEAKMTISRAVYLFSIGSNDYMSPFLTNSTILHNYSDSIYVGMVIGNLTTVIKEIYKRGGRKFAFINLPDLGCLPGMRIIKSENNGSCLEHATSLAILHNKALSKLPFELGKRLKGFKYSLFDFNSSLRKRMLHPSKYGFKEGEAACCGTGKYRGVYSCGGKRRVKEFQLCKNPNDFLDLVRSHGLPKNHVALFILGDSVFDPGNNNYINTISRANYWPYGETFFKYPTGRFCDGRLTSDFIAEYANLPLIPPYLQPGNHQFTYGVNFASAGAGALAETNRGFVIDMKTQLSYFKKVEKLLRQERGDAEAKTIISKAVYLINFGPNDYVSPFTSNSTVLQSFSKEEYVGMVIGNLTETIKEIYRKGGRKFGFRNLGQLGCVPLLKILVPGNTGSCFEEVTELAKLHDVALSKALQELEINLVEFKYAMHDLSISFGERLNNPEKYGFKEADTACCGSGPYRGISSCGGKRGVTEYELCSDPTEYLFFDSSHLSEKGNMQIAELMWSGAPNITRPYNLKALFEA
ncbi:hypothetical protein DITRI_Ditri02bG0070200 [Diplodiscus trichospermus]